VGTIIGFVMTGDGEVVRMHTGGKPNNETTMLRQRRMERPRPTDRLLQFSGKGILISVCYID